MIEIITKKLLIDYFNLDYELNMKDILIQIEIHNFKNGPLFINQDYKFSGNFQVKYRINDICNKIGHNYHFYQMKDKIAITLAYYL